MGLFNRKKKDITNMVFDWDAYYKDVENHMPFDKRMKKMENFDYYVSISSLPYEKIPVAAYAK